MISNQKYAEGIDAVFAASGYYRGWDGWKDAVEGATTLPAGVTIDEFGRNPDPYRGVARVDTTKFFQLLEEKVIRPVVDAATMLYRAPYLTRLYSPMSADERAVDPCLQLQRGPRARQRHPHRQAVHPVQPHARAGRRAMAHRAAPGRRDRGQGQRLAGGGGIDAGEPQDRAALDHGLGRRGQGPQRRDRDEAASRIAGRDRQRHGDAPCRRSTA